MEIDQWAKEMQILKDRRSQLKKECELYERKLDALWEKREAVNEKHKALLAIGEKLNGLDGLDITSTQK